MVEDFAVPVGADKPPKAGVHGNLLAQSALALDAVKGPEQLGGQQQSQRIADDSNLAVGGVECGTKALPRLVEKSTDPPQRVVKWQNLVEGGCAEQAGLLLLASLHGRKDESEANVRRCSTAS